MIVLDASVAVKPSPDTRSNYQRDLEQFLSFAGIPQDQPEHLVRVLPRQISAWHDHLASEGQTLLTRPRVRPRAPDALSVSP